MGQSRAIILLAVTLLSVAVPAAMIAGVALSPIGSVADLLLISLAATLWMTLLVLVNWWEFIGLGWRWLWGAALAAAVVRRLAEPGAPQPPAPMGWLALMAAAVAAAAAWMLWRVLAARRHQGNAIALTFPLAGGRFLVTDGGDGAASWLVNYHYGFGRHRASGVNASMRYAMDVVEVDAFGRAAHGVVPRDNAACRIWERPLLAPCDGQVVHVVNDVPDNSAFGSDRPYGVGNHVVLRTRDDVHVVLGHMRQGSVCVATGDAVTAGSAIGRVGNSGWTERPHLHMQAMRSASGDWWHGEAVPTRFAGRFLVRNQVVRG